MITPLTKLRGLLSNNKLDAILISSVSNIVYLTNYSGFSKDEREAYLFVTKNKQYILTDGRYITAVKALIPDFKLIEISHKLSFEEIIRQLTKKHSIKRLGFEGHDINFLEHKRIKKHFNNIYHVNISALQTIKTPQEISAIEKACKIGDKTFDYILKKIKLGVSEKQIANEIEFFIKKNGADLSFPSIVGFGKNSAVPHHQATNNKLTN
ncbi:MAG: aminopeptidase P family N-terminal domain-containing protein, partial [Candidatus Levybacteria bacterium]|nr:aminopeptidase P family N-terminal domain-containing protein [Candidatus Levybacteria bacterium]